MVQQSTSTLVLVEGDHQRRQGHHPSIAAPSAPLASLRAGAILTPGGPAFGVPHTRDQLEQLVLGSAAPSTS